MAKRPAKTSGSIDRGSGVALGEAVFRSLCEALQAGSYRAGDRLREEEVAQRLNVSRTPVREALGRLAARGFVQPAAGRGVIVRNLDISEVLELYAMREILEGAAARLAAEHASHLEIDAMTDIEQALTETSGDAAEMARLNRAFHEAICRAARNRYLDSASKELQDWIALLGPTTFSVTDRPEASHREHQAIISAIAARDSDEAERLARAHIRAALRCRLKLLQKQWRDGTGRSITKPCGNGITAIAISRLNGELSEPAATPARRTPMTVSKMRPAVLALTVLAVGTVALAAAPVSVTARPIAGARVAPTRPAAHAYRTRQTPASHIRAPQPSDHPDGTFPFIWLG